VAGIGVRGGIRGGIRTLKGEKRGEKGLSDLDCWESPKEEESESKRILLANVLLQIRMVAWWKR
jgi:hypothetical protein